MPAEGEGQSERNNGTDLANPTSEYGP